MKRRIKCDLTLPKCKKCAKKGLECPGYGIRYRFYDDNTTVLSEISHQAASFPRPARDWKWVDDTRRKRARVHRQSIFNTAGSTSKGLEHQNTFVSQVLPAVEGNLVARNHHAHISQMHKDVVYLGPNHSGGELVLPTPARPLCNLPPKMRLFFHHCKSLAGYRRTEDME